MDELLEMAAKAVGNRAKWLPEYDGDDTACGGCFCVDGIEWNPRADDGDSRRLQMELGLSLTVMTSFLVASTRLCDGTWIQAREDFNADGDACDSARLAVLRVAADIGRRMP